MLRFSAAIRWSSAACTRARARRARLRSLMTQTVAPPTMSSSKKMLSTQPMPPGGRSGIARNEVDQARDDDHGYGHDDGGANDHRENVSASAIGILARDAIGDDDRQQQGERLQLITNEDEGCDVDIDGHRGAVEEHRAAEQKCGQHLLAGDSSPRRQHRTRGERRAAGGRTP